MGEIVTDDVAIQRHDGERAKLWTLATQKQYGRSQRNGERDILATQNLHVESASWIDSQTDQ
jgi:hypothetical protein